MHTHFASIELSKPIEKKSPPIIDLSADGYRNSDGSLCNFPVVEAIRRAIAMDVTLDHEYLPIRGLDSFQDAVLRLVLGNGSPAIIENNAICSQTLGIKNSFRIAADFLKSTDRVANTILIPKQSDSSRMEIFQAAGFDNIKQYSVLAFFEDSHIFDIDAFKRATNDIPRGTILVLSPSSQYPTGVPIGHAQWEDIATIIISKGIFVIFDVPYLGFGTGDTAEDAWAIRYFAKLGLTFMVAVSFSENFGIHDDPTGALILVADNTVNASNCASQIESIISASYTNPPQQGSRIVATVLNNECYRREWNRTLSEVYDHSQAWRKKFYELTRIKGFSKSWKFVTQQEGLFIFTAFKAEKIEYLKNEYSIAIREDGAINISTITDDNIYSIVSAFYEILD